MLFFLLINVTMSTIVGILTFYEQEKFMLSCVQHENIFITSGPNLVAKYIWQVSVLFAYILATDQSSVVQSIIGLTSLFRGQLVKCFTTL